MLEGTKQRVDIYYERNGVRAHLPLMVRTDDHGDHTVEHAIVQILNGRGRTFEELAVERGWQNAYWTYPSGVIEHDTDRASAFVAAGLR